MGKTPNGKAGHGNRDVDMLNVDGQYDTGPTTGKRKPVRDTVESPRGRNRSSPSHESVDLEDLATSNTPSTTPRRIKPTPGRKRHRVVEGSPTRESVSPPPDPSLTRLTEGFPRLSTWETASLYSGLTGEAKQIFKDTAILILKFIAGPKVGIKFDRYDLTDCTSVIAFLMEQFGLRPALIRPVKSKMKYGRLWEITLAPGTDRSLVRSLPAELCKVAPGIGLLFFAPRKHPPKTITILVDNLPLFVETSDVEEAVAVAFGGALTTSNLTRLYTNGVALGIVQGSISLIPNLVDASPAQIPEEILAPHTMEFFSVPLTVKGVPTRLHRSSVCGACGDAAHNQSACPHFLRLMAADMASMVFMGSQQKPTTVTIPPQVVPRIEPQGPDEAGSSMEKGKGKGAPVAKDKPVAETGKSTGKGKNNKGPGKSKGKGKGKGKA